MKNTIHYSNITFLTLLILVLLYGLSNKDMGIIGVILVLVGWSTTQIIKAGLGSLFILLAQNEDEKD